MKKNIAMLCALFAFAFIAAESFNLTYYQEFDRNGNITYEKYEYGYETFAEYDRKGQQTYYKSTVDGETETEAWISYYENGQMKSCRIFDYEEEYYYEFDHNGKERFIKSPDGITYRYYNDQYGNNMYAVSSDGEKAFFAYTDEAIHAKYTYKGETTFYTFDPNNFYITSEYTVDGSILPYDQSEDFYDDEDYDDYDYADDYEYDEDYDYNYDDYSDYDSYYDYLDEDDDYYQETDSHGNVTLVRTSYYTEKYEYTYYGDGSVKSVKCYEGE